MVPFLLLGLFAATEPAARWELQLTLEGGLASAGSMSGMSTTGPGSPSPIGGLAFDAIRYRRPVVDDATPRALQPFLQRLGQLRFSLAAGARPDLPFAVPHSTLRGTTFLDAAVSAEHYFTRRLLGNAQVGYHLADSGPGARLLGVPLAIGIAFRPGDLQIGAAIHVGYARDPAAGADRWDSYVTADLRAVLLEHIDLQVGIRAAQGDFAARVLIAYHPDRRLGLSLGGSGEHGGDPSRQAGDTLAFLVGVAFWGWPSLGFGLSYAPSWTVSSVHSGDGLFQHRLTLVIQSRGG